MSAGDPDIGYQPGEGYQPPELWIGWKPTIFITVVVLALNVMSDAIGLRGLWAEYLPSWVGPLCLIAIGLFFILGSHAMPPRAGAIFFGVLSIVIGASFFIYIP